MEKIDTCLKKKCLKIEVPINYLFSAFDSFFIVVILWIFSGVMGGNNDIELVEVSEVYK